MVPFIHARTRAGALCGVALGILATVANAATAPAPAVTVHYAPGENLERIDVDLIRSARSSIDLAGYVVTDWPIADELVKAAARGVVVRVVLDPSQRHALDRLALILPSIRRKKAGALMHLKSYAIDGTVLRSGSANFSPSGLKRQDNDLIVIRDPAAVRAFLAQFANIWQSAEPIPSP